VGINLPTTGLRANECYEVRDYLSDTVVEPVWLISGSAIMENDTKLDRLENFVSMKQLIGPLGKAVWWNEYIVQNVDIMAKQLKVVWFYAQMVELTLTAGGARTRSRKT
jgi:hypothetical protein